MKKNIKTHLTTSILLLASINIAFAAPPANNGKKNDDAEIPCDYYVDSSQDGNGSDTLQGYGLTPEQPWKSLQKVMTYSASPRFSPGDRICFKRGERFYNFYNGQFHSSGTINDPIILTSYGTETAQAKLSVAKEIGVSSVADWTIQENGNFLYTGYSGSVVSMLWENNRVLRKSFSTTLEHPGSWFYEQGVGLHYRPFTNSNPWEQEIYLANNSQVIILTDANDIGVSNLIIDDLEFEFSGVGIQGDTRNGRTHHNITVTNCNFTNISTGISFESRTIETVEYLNTNINILDNTFYNIRYGIKFTVYEEQNEVRVPATTPTKGVTVSGNKFSNISLHGDYALSDPNGDIEVISFQNLQSSRVTSNKISRGVKKGEGLTNHQGDPLFATGIINWVSTTTSTPIIPKSFDVEITGNYINDVSRAIIFGAGVGELIENITIANNIISNSEIGIRLNNSDPTGTSGVYYNTLHNNDISISIFSGGAGYQFKNNLSSNPVDFHMQVAQSTGLSSTFEHNMYTPDGPLFIYTNNVTNTVPYLNFDDWILQTLNDETGSLSTADAGYESTNPQVDTDYKLLRTSDATSAGVELVEIVTDYIGNNRPKGKGVEIGAWER